jgi:hypothetical protein
MTTSDTVDVDPAAPPATDEAPAGNGGGGPAPAPDARDRRVRRLALAVALVPFAVAAVALAVAVGGRYLSVADQALIELHTRDVGRETPLVGLYSRGEWSHPGPILFYVLAPFYWLAGGRAVGLSIGALAINAASIAGLALVARRRGGTPLMLLTLLGSTLLLRTLGADFASDPWNCFITTLPFALLIFLAWSLWCGEAWALPLAAGVATFLAQTHVGFVLLALPLVVWGAIGLVVAAVRPPGGRRTAAEPAPLPEPEPEAEPGGAVEPDGAGDGEAAAGQPGATRPSVRRLALVALATVGVLAVLWAPTFIDVLVHDPSNLGLIRQWFGGGGGEGHTLGEGWRVMSGQFSALPEWLITKRAFLLSGETPYLVDAPLPLMLVPVAAAAVVLWRRGTRVARSYVLTLVFVFVVGVVAVARTVGLAFDYRLRWTFVVGMLGLVAVAWAAWGLAARRWPGVERRVLVPLTLGAIAVVATANAFTGATAGTPQAGDSASMNTLMPQVYDALGDVDGPVLVDDGLNGGAWQARSLVLELEKHGYDVVVPEDRGAVYGRQRVVHGNDYAARLVITADIYLDGIAANPDLRRIAWWTAIPEDEQAPLLAERQRITDAIDAGELTPAEGAEELAPVNDALRGHSGSVSYQVAVFRDTSVGQVAAPAP